MVSVGAKEFHSSYLGTTSDISSDSPVFPRMLFFKNMCHLNEKQDKGTKYDCDIEFEENGKLHAVEDEFYRKVLERKRRGFTGNEFTVEKAVHQQFGPKAVDARAFLEYYWETKAKCLDAVEKGRDSEVENFKRHPLFSPYWLNPTKRDIRWHIQKKKEKKRGKIMISKIPVRIRESEVKRNPPDSSNERLHAAGCSQNKKSENRFRSKIPIYRRKETKNRKGIARLTQQNYIPTKKTKLKHEK